MSATLINRSRDLSKLEADGYRLRVVQKVANHLLVEGIPAVNSRKEVFRGSLYCPLELNGTGVTVSPVSNHQCWWIGTEVPCDVNGRPMDELIASKGVEDKGDGITTVAGMSRKLKTTTGTIPYSDFYQKVTTYIALIAGPAMTIDPLCNPKVDKPVQAVVEAQTNIFHYPDMATTRAGIGAATQKLLVDKVAVIGLGGTGSYILDLLAKCPIGEIHLFDGDVFDVHNAFRAPGAPDAKDFTSIKKVDWFGSIYDRMRKGICRHPYHVEFTRLPELVGFNYVFIAIDNPEAKKLIVEFLIEAKIPFIDSGMDLSLDKDLCLRGQCRVTVGTPAMNAHIPQTISFSAGSENDVYRNIQVADLNMFNASLAVIAWKKMLGFYGDDMRAHHILHNVQAGALIREIRSEE